MHYHLSFNSYSSFYKSIVIISDTLSYLPIHSDLYLFMIAVISKVKAIRMGCVILVAAYANPITPISPNSEKKDQVLISTPAVSNSQKPNRVRKKMIKYTKRPTRPYFANKFWAFEFMKDSPMIMATCLV